MVKITFLGREEYEKRVSRGSQSLKWLQACFYMRLKEDNFLVWTAMFSYKSQKKIIWSLVLVEKKKKNEDHGMAPYVYYRSDVAICVVKTDVSRSRLSFQNYETNIFSDNKN